MPLGRLFAAKLLKISLDISSGILRSMKYRDNCIIKISIRVATLMYYEILFNKYRNDTRKYGKTIFYQDLVKRKHYRQVLEKVTVN